ncbi:tRNA (adenosine(37)-N6)-threonylcarbamoyltransferase complex dimerization subunit type 1 TsaB [Bifidobacterium sp.]|uniref:tRNA (adenosine(37)-N6)-threonylcarbamoyltransferase complex dimerization subunit type 1 TsaB n=1 Tax=Bifidobacterium sp. TaxID=41200 RepID=UPI0039EC7564
MDAPVRERKGVAQAEGPILVIDTSFGSTVGIVGQRPISQSDSRSHVENLQPNIDRAVTESGLSLGDIATIVVGVGPAPFTGLRAGIVTAKALAFATGATLIGQNVLEPEAAWMGTHSRCDETDAPCGEDESQALADGTGSGRSQDASHLVLAVNDARRKQLYFGLYLVNPRSAGKDESAGCASDSLPPVVPVDAVMPIDIDYPDNIVSRVNTYLEDLSQRSAKIRVDVMGHGIERYAEILNGIECLQRMHEGSVLESGTEGIEAFAALAMAHHRDGDDTTANPMYVRRPDVQMPNPLKRVVNPS